MKLFDKIESIVALHDECTMKQIPAKEKVTTVPDFWTTGRYFLVEYRYELIHHFNSIMGPPACELERIQERFLLCRMAPGESLAFIQVCLGLIRRSVVPVMPI